MSDTAWKVSDQEITGRRGCCYHEAEMGRHPVQNRTLSGAVLQTVDKKGLSQNDFLKSFEAAPHIKKRETYFCLGLFLFSKTDFSFTALLDSSVILSSMFS